MRAVHPVTREVWIGGSTYGIWKYPPPGPDAAGPPTARLTSPTSGTIVQAPGEVVLAAEAQDEDGSIVRVEFFVDKQKIGETDTAPYSLTWNVENPGLYNLQVVAVDNDGTFTDTTEIAVEAIPKESYSENFDDGFAQGWTVLNGDWQVEDQRYQSPEPTSAKIAVFDSIAFGSYTYQVEAVPSFGNFFGLIFQYQDADNYYLLKIDGSPNDISLEKVENGTTTVVAASTYPQGGQGTSNAIAVVYNRGFANVRLNDALIFSGVNMGAFRTGRIGLYADFNPVQFDDLRIDPLLIDGVPPQVAISFPPTDTVFNDPASFTITAEANDPDGEVARVVFQINGIEVGEDTEAPYTYTTNALGTGDYVLEAIATDSDSLATISQSVSIQVFPEGTYRENFDDGRAQGWQSISGNWIVEDSAYRTTDVTGGKRAVYQGTTFENYIYQLDAFPSFGNDFGVLFQYQDTDNYYRLRLDANPRTASLEKIQDGSVIEIATTTYPTGGERTNNAIAVTYESGLTSVSINDTLVFDQVSTPDSTSGKIGLYGDFNPVSFDNIRVEAIRRVEALVVVAECSENSDTGRSWSIVNPNRQPIPYTWHLLDTSQQGDSLAQSGENRLVTAVGDAFVITWEDEMGKIQIDTAYTNEVAEPSLSRPRPFIIPLHRSDSSQVIRMQSRQSLPTLVVVSTEPIKAIPQDGTNYLSDLVLSAGDSIASGTYVVWVDSTGNEQFTVTGLSPRTRYYAAAYVFASGNGCGPNYLERRVATTRFRTLPSRPCPIPRSTVLYPNPSSGQLTIKAGACAQELLTVTLVGKTGQASVLGTYLLEPGFTNLSFDLSDQLDGTYLVELQSSVRRQVRRWVKQE